MVLPNDLDFDNLGETATPQATSGRFAIESDGETITSYDTLLKAKRHLEREGRSDSMATVPDIVDTGTGKRWFWDGFSSQVTAE